MGRVTGIGGIFFTSRDPEKTREWYKAHLGLNTDQYGTTFEWRQSDSPEKKGFSQWSPMNHDSDYFEYHERDFIINFRVENIEKLIEDLRAAGVSIVSEIQAFEYGKFAQILDPEGNKLELWEPRDAEYEKIIDQVTK